MRLTIMCGIPRSGKTTKANALAEETGATIIRHDQYYSRIITPTTWVTKEHLAQVADLAIADVRAHLLAGEDVIYDATNTSRSERDKVRSVCDIDGCEYVCVYMQTPEETCFERDAGLKARLLAPTLEPPTQNEGWNVIVSYDGRATNNDVQEDE